MHAWELAINDDDDATGYIYKIFIFIYHSLIVKEITYHLIEPSSDLSFPLARFESVTSGGSLGSTSPPPVQSSRVRHASAYQTVHNYQVLLLFDLMNIYYTWENL